ncbi:hypothetical protein GCM10027348_21300 [Hymenobacter tenuis]
MVVQVQAQHGCFRGKHPNQQDDKSPSNGSMPILHALCTQIMKREDRLYFEMHHCCISKLSAGSAALSAAGGLSRAYPKYSNTPAALPGACPAPIIRWAQGQQGPAPAAYI